MNHSKIERRCKTLLDTVFPRFIKQIDLYIAHYWEFQTTQVVSTGLTMSKPLLLDAMVHYFLDMQRYKSINGYQANKLATPLKVGALMAYWLAAKQPIYDTHQTDYAPVVNRDFALYVGLTAAEIDPLKVKSIRVGKESASVYLQLQQTLAFNRTCSDALIPTFQLLSELAK